MRKKLLLLLTAALVSASVSAAPVTKTQALKKAQAFVGERSKSVMARPLQLVTGADCLKEASERGNYYVFNVGENDGFVVVSGDDRTTAILGYADHGRFDSQRMPSNVRAFFESYNKQMEALRAMSDTQARRMLAAPAARTRTTRNSIAPMLTSKWDQATPYWNECPEFVEEVDGEEVSELAYTGCVATAMSQIMYFHKYPAATNDPVPAYTFTYGDDYGNYGTATMESQPVTTFDWDHMLDTYTGAEDEVYTSAVAHLMLYVGCSVETQYGKSASGAYTDAIPKGFDFFGYGARLAFRNDYTQQEWENLVYEELAAGRPMIYNGTAGSGGGHSFVCDGFEYGDYFHINWGWGGMSNGFYQLAILNPHASGSGGSSSAEGYNMKQSICYGIIPGMGSGHANGSGTTNPDDPDAPEPVLTITSMSGPQDNSYGYAWERDRKSDAFKIYKSKVVKVGFSDHSGTGAKFKEALALYDPEADSYTLIANSESYMFSTVTTSALGQTTKFGDGLQANASGVMKFGAGLTGNYRLVPMYCYQKSDGTVSEWKPMQGTDRIYMELNITNYAASPTYHPQFKLAVKDWQFTGGEQVGKAEQVHCFIENTGQDRFFGDLYLDFGGQAIDEMSNYTTVVQAEVLPGTTAEVVFNVTPQTAGNKTVTLMLVDPMYGGFVEQANPGHVTITETLVLPMDLSVVIKAENAEPAEVEGDNDVIYDSHARFSAVVTNNSEAEYNKYVLAPLFIVNKDEAGNISGSMVTYKQATLSLMPGESTTLYFDFDNLAYGSTYSLNVYARNDVPDDSEESHMTNLVKHGESIYYDIKHGIITWTASGERLGNKPVEGFQVPENVAAVSLEGLNMRNIVPNENPNTLYFFSKSMRTPANLVGKNVVMGKSAKAITLKDGYDFFTPQSFTADAISYERTFASPRVKGHSEGWQTMVLPFAATKVTNATDNAYADWFRSADEQDKQLWICEFVDAQADSVYFDYAQTLAANVPYLVGVSQETLGNEEKTLVWSAENATVTPEAAAFTSTVSLAFGGTMQEQSLQNVYRIDDSGCQFDAADESRVDAFHAYFMWISNAPDLTSLFISTPDLITEQGAPTAIAVNTEVNSAREDAVFNLNGQRVGTSSQLRQLPRGIYVVGGKRVLR